MTRTLQTLFFIQFFNLFTVELLNPVYAAYVANIGGNLFTAGSALSVRLAIIGILIFVSGQIAGKYHTEKLQLVTGYSIGLVVVIGYLLINTPVQLFVLQILLGLSIAVAQPAYNGMFSSRLRNGSHSSRWGSYFAMTYFSGALAALSSGFISQTYGFDFLFYTMIFTQSLGVLGTFYLYFLDDRNFAPTETLR